MKKTVIAFMVILKLFAIYGHYAKIPVTKTRYGSVIGSLKLARCGSPYESYRGIPFAKPPIGNLRFKAPQPPAKWRGTFDATKEGPYCIQKNYFFSDNPTVEGQEDCLYLNVYVPTITTDDYAEYSSLLPVMVFIHWGGFFAGKGTSDYLDPEYFMDEDVILVTFNYRLGIIGQLSTLDDEAPGNYGLKDQRAALRWVQENIAYFGGDKDSVTIFGQSAGAASVHYHIISPLSNGLFQKAIAQSGSALALWASPGNALQPSVLAAQATFVGCESYIGNSAKLIKCLRKVPAETLLQSQDLFKQFYVDPLTVYTTVTETQTDANPEPFFTKSPLEYIEAGEFSPVPWIIGVVQNEGIVKAAPILRQKKIREDFNKDFDNLLNTLLYLNLSTSDVENLEKNITEHFLQDNHYVDITNPDSIQGFINLYSQRSFVYSSYQSALLQSAKGHKPIWFYNFDYRGEYTYGDYFASTNEEIDFDWGVSHCDDLLYLFKSPGLFPPLRQTNDIVTSYMMVNLWTHFAKYGQPPEKFTWEPLNINGLDDMRNENLCYLNITGHYETDISLETICGFNKEDMQFWTSQNLYENIDGLR